MAELIGREVKIGDKEGEITNVLGIGYEITFFDINLGRTFIDSRDIYDYLIQQEILVSFETKSQSISLKFSIIEENKNMWEVQPQ